MKTNALILKRISQEYGVLPHELLKQPLIDFNFDVAVTIFADKIIEDLKDVPQGSTAAIEKNKFATTKTKGSQQFTQNEFESLFGKAFVG